MKRIAPAISWQEKRKKIEQRNKILSYPQNVKQDEQICIEQIEQSQDKISKQIEQSQDKLANKNNPNITRPTPKG